MRIAVTGGSGHVGVFVLRELLARGHDVTNVDRREPKERGARFISADLTDRAQVQPVLETVDAVCHLGEIPSIHVKLPPEEIYAHNTRAGAVVMQTAADLKLARAIYTSSAQVYGMWDNAVARPVRLPFDETHPIGPHNAYAAGKGANELYARLMAERHGLSIAAFRLPWVEAAEYSDRVAESMREMPAKTDGFATYVHGTDAARAFALAIENPRAGFEVYHFSAAEIFSLQPLVKRLKAHHPDYPPLPNDWPAFGSPVLTHKAREHFGWEPRWNFLDFYRQRHGEPAAA